MAIAYVTGISAAGVSTFSTGTTNPGSLSGALVLVATSYYTGFSPGSNFITDNQGNGNYTPLTAVTAVDPKVNIYYMKNANTANGMTWTMTGTGSYAAISAFVFTGADTSAPFVQQSAGATGAGGGTIQPGALTPSAGSVLFTVGGFNRANAAAPTIDGSFSSVTFGTSGTNFAAGNNYGGVGSYLIGGSGSTNPTWTFDTAITNIAVTMAEFKVAAASGWGPLINTSGLRNGLIQVT